MLCQNADDPWAARVTQAVDKLQHGYIPLHRGYTLFFQVLLTVFTASPAGFKLQQEIKDEQ